MPIIFNGNENPRAITYNGNTVRTVVYNGVIVWGGPDIYTGGDGSNIFNYYQEYSKDSSEYAGTDYSSITMSTMSGDVRYYGTTSHTWQGGVRFKTQDSYDLSLYSTLTLKVKIRSDNYRVGCHVVLRPTNSSDVTEHAYGNNGYVTVSAAPTSETEYTLTCDLSTYKASYSSGYFQISASAYKADGGYDLNLWSHFQIVSLVLS